MCSVSVFVCGKPATRVTCSRPGCTSRAVTGCSYALRGKKAGQRCDRPLCADCGGEAKTCPPHARMALR